MGYLRSGHKTYNEKPEAKLIPSTQRLLPPHVEMKKSPQKYPDLKVLHFPLLKNDLLVPQLTLREIARTIIEWTSRLDRHEAGFETAKLFTEQHLSAMEKDYVLGLIPKLVEQELRDQIVNGGF
jgi:hypothetical protein